jgi:hypothetical protein
MAVLLALWELHLQQHVLPAFLDVLRVPQCHLQLAAAAYMDIFFILPRVVV